MSLIDSTVKSEFVDKTREDELGEVIETKKFKVTTRFYPCRPEVLERKKWKKFGQVEGVPRGEHKPGDFTQSDKVKFENDEGNQDEELDLVKQLKQASKQSMMMKNLGR